MEQSTILDQTFHKVLTRTNCTVIQFSYILLLLPPIPTAFLALLSMESLFGAKKKKGQYSCRKNDDLLLTWSLLLPLMLSAALWEPDFWLCCKMSGLVLSVMADKREELTLGCIAAAPESMALFILSPACSTKPFWESGCVTDGKLCIVRVETDNHKIYLHGRANLVGHRLAAGVGHVVLVKKVKLDRTVVNTATVSSKERTLS